MTNVVCETCGSQDVFRDASAEWDNENNEWALRATFDAAYCETCDSETKLVEVESNTKKNNVADRQTVIEKLKGMGLLVGDRDPNMNTNYDGAFMVAEPVQEGDPYPTVDAADGRFCIVGDNLDDIAKVAYQHLAT